MDKMSLSKTLILLTTIVNAKTLARTHLPYPCDCDTKAQYNMNCGKYFECENGQLFLSDCDNGLYFDENLQNCVHPDLSSCKPDFDCTADLWVNGPCHCTYNKHVPFEWNCGKFYQCGSGTLRLMPCPPGLYFNEAISVCDYPENVPCHLPCNGTIFKASWHFVILYIICFLLSY